MTMKNFAKTSEKQFQNISSAAMSGYEAKKPPIFNSTQNSNTTQEQHIDRTKLLDQKIKKKKKRVLAIKICH